VHHRGRRSDRRVPEFVRGACRGRERIGQTFGGGGAGDAGGNWTDLWWRGSLVVLVVGGGG
jgi:hypothetical protein